MDTFIYILKSASILTLFYLVYRIVLRKDTFFTANRHFLISGIITSLLLPLLIFTKTVYVDAPVSKTIINFNNASEIQNISETSVISIDLWTITTGIYLIGIVFMSFRFLKQLFSLHKLIGSQTVTTSNGFNYVKTKENISPFSFFKYIVYNPEKHSETDLKMILKHEQAHASQLHSIDIILSNLLLITQWMNPFAWLYKKGIEENLEFLADNETIKNVSSKKEYQITMLKSVTSATLQPLLANNFYQSLIKKRIIMLHKNQSSSKNQWKLLLILPLLGVFLWSFNVEEEIKYNDYAISEIPEIINAEISSEEISIPVISKTVKPTVKNNVVISKKIKKHSDSKITVSINKNTTDTELENLKKLFNDNYGVSLKFSGIKRNSAGEITAIKVKMKSKNSSTSYHVDEDESISEFTISYNKDNDSISIGSNDQHNLHVSPKVTNGYTYEIIEGDNEKVSTWVSSDANVIKGKVSHVIRTDSNVNRDHRVHVISGSGGNSNVWVSKDGKATENKNRIIIVERVEESTGNGNEESIFIIKDENGDGDTIFIETEDNSDSIFIKSNGKSRIFISDENNEKSILYFLNGKKVDAEIIKNIDSKSINEISVIKGDATKKYGKEAKDGVILITTKN